VRAPPPKAAAGLGPSYLPKMLTHNHALDGMICGCFLFDCSCCSARGVQEGPEPELDKEFGDAGKDAEIIDEKMWNGEDDSDAATDEEKNEDKKDDGARQEHVPLLR
jgi:hypothetical protein